MCRREAAFGINGELLVANSRAENRDWDMPCVGRPGSEPARAR